jgi:hypothetical protein
MDLQQSVTLMLDARAKLRTREGIESPSYISREMMRLAQATGAVEEHLAELEERIEIDEMNIFNGWLADGKSINQAEMLSKQEVGALKGQVAKLKRYVNSSWAIIGTAQSRFNHLSKSNAGQI